MKLPDVNLWLALTLSGHTHHAVASAWLEGESARSSVFLCRATQQGLLRLLTTSAVLAPYDIPPLSNRAAWAVVDAFLADDRIAFMDEPMDTEILWKEWALRETASPKLWMDAWLAAVARRGGLQIVTFDKGFREFQGLDLLLLTRQEQAANP